MPYIGARYLLADIAPGRLELPADLVLRCASSCDQTAIAQKRTC